MSIVPTTSIRRNARTRSITHPKVADAAVFGVPNEAMGEEMKGMPDSAAGAEMEAPC